MYGIRARFLIRRQCTLNGGSIRQLINLKTEKVDHIIPLN